MFLWVAVCLHISSFDKKDNYWFETMKTFHSKEKCEKLTATYNKSSFGKNYRCHSFCIKK